MTFEINGQIIKNKTDANGQAVLTLNLKKGNYTITTTYINIKKTNKLEIVETYQLTGINVKSYENFDFEYIVTLKNHNDKAIENAEITFEINGQTYKNKTDADGKVKLTLNLKKGNYTIKTTYNDISTTNKLEIIEYDLEKIISEDVEMFYHDGTRFKIQLLNQTTQLVNKTVQITINGATYTRTTDNNGSASIGLNLNAGRYRVTTKYDILEKNNTITVTSTIKGNDITKVFKNSTQYYATFYNSKGELLKNTNITFNINGVFYTRTTNENGTARININLPQGTYTITATNPETKEQHSNTVTVISKIQENTDLTKYYRNASQYTLKIIDEKGNPAKAGQKVTFNINGVFYERYTNESGYVKMNINLQPGTYIITAEYEGCRVSNTIKVLPVLKAEDLTMKYKDGSKFKATLVDSKGKPYANQEVIFNINGVFYTRNTDENGIAQLNINLMSGKYIITSSYNGSNTANTIKIE
ncbi:carboxypeptidase-like regulatory domain-containing protein [uncultured Methanobrevibacter sp.]|uniref:carboxypeptidase-like regulatory domain-containing protein n=1 Tax=uncultured Methanobrevibacter sp. TaxID=253161 RepID=UPI0025F0B195|nr:carboxypeptidase-like regulatory domain-containing protein [uncultured Methanobrevibacter sp.]